MNNLIQQLKDNKKPFGLMSEEMQAKAREIGAEKFSRFCSDGFGTNNGHLDGTFTYRLRDTYEDEPEIVECEITEGRNGTLSYDRKDGITSCSLGSASSYPDFIGFKFADGCWRTSPIYYQMPTFCNDQIHPDKTSDFVAKIVLHATHVLFRRKKQE